MKKVTEMSDTEKEEKELEIKKIDTVDKLFEYLIDDILHILRDKNQGYEIQELFKFYHRCMIDNYVDDDCSELAQNVITDPLSITLWKRYKKDLFDAEYYLNTKLGVETRRGKEQDDFRPLSKICKDIAKVYGAKVDDSE
jgi:hypothetical protein